MKTTLAALSATVLAVGGLTVASAPTYAAIPPTQCPIVASHAAGPPLAPENTTAGIRAVADAGATWVEMDVRWSKGDGTAAYPGWPVLMHDTTIDRTTDGTGTVSALGLGEMTSKSAAAYAPWSSDPEFNGYVDGKPRTGVPYAYDFLATVKDTGITGLLDVKVTPNRVQADKLMEYVDRFPGLRSKLVYMGSAASVKAMSGWYPDLGAYVLIEYPPANQLRSVKWIKAQGADAYALPIQNGDLSKGAVDYWKSGGLKVYSWTSDGTPAQGNEQDTQANWKRAADMGVDVVITNETETVNTYYTGTLCPGTPRR